MSKIDHFESAFRSSIRIQYQPRAFPIRDILVVTDLSAEEDVEFLTQLEPLFSGVTPPPRLTLLPKEQSESLPDLIAEVKSQNPDLICTYRNIHTDHGQYPYTIGDHVEVLMPRMSDTMEEGKILKWLKQQGDQVEIGDIMT